MTSRTLSSSTSSSTSSSSSSDGEEKTTGAFGTSGNIQQTGSQYRETSPRASPRSTGATGTPFDDAASVATTDSTGFTNATNAAANAFPSQQQVARGGIPTTRPPVLQQQLSGTSTSSSNQPIQIDVASAHQQYAQAQFANQLPGQQSFNELLGADAFKDAALNIDYGAIEAYNVGMESAGDITAEQLSGNIDAAKDIFKQGNTNREDFRQSTQGSQQNVGGQSYSNYQTTSTNYGNNFNGDVNPEIANILQQSGFQQGYANYR